MDGYALGHVAVWCLGMLLAVHAGRRHTGDSTRKTESAESNEILSGGKNQFREIGEGANVRALVILIEQHASLYGKSVWSRHSRCRLLGNRAVFLPYAFLVEWCHD